MIKPLTLGNKTFTNNVIQGPLAGISCAPFRELVWRYSRPAFSCTEMISCKALLHQPKHSHERYIIKSAQEGPVCFQLSANDPQELAEATQRVTAYGADLIDLNCGCPVKKIRSKGAGSSLLADPAKLYHLIRAMKQHTHVPVSVKIRVDSRSNDNFNALIAKVVTEAGADFLIVHGRHWSEHYETPCNYDQIRFFVEALKIPVIGNGDIACIASLKKMLDTGCAGVMIARAGVGQPWLIQRLMAELQGVPFVFPEKNEVAQIFIEHVISLAQLLKNEKFAVLQARRFAKYYARNWINKHAFAAAMNQCNTLEEMEKITLSHFG